MQACNKIQPDIIFMILKSEGEKIKFIASPQRDRKYAIVAFSKLMEDTVQHIGVELLSIIARALVELCTTVPSNGF